MTFMGLHVYFASYPSDGAAAHSITLHNILSHGGEPWLFTPIYPGKLDSPLFHVVSVPHHTMPPYTLSNELLFERNMIYKTFIADHFFHIPYWKKNGLLVSVFILQKP